MGARIMTDIDTELYPKAESRHGMASGAFKTAKRALRDERISGLTGALLAMFIWGHLLAESSIIFGKDAYNYVANFLEYTVPVAKPVLFVITILFFVHVVWASRKIPGKLRERKRMLELGESLQKSRKGWNQDPKSDIKLRKHFETSLWITQVRTGMIVLVTGGFHLILITWNLFSDMGFGFLGFDYHPHPILNYDLTSARMTSGLWILYAVLMLSVVAHMAIGVYRLLVKWFADTWFVRNYAKAFFYLLFSFYTVWGTITIIAASGAWKGVLS
jgi:fumarate reductase subunit C